MDAFDVMMAALRFNERINARDLEGLSAMMASDHTFIDRDGNVDAGREQMTEGWRNFFERFPDYRNVFTRVQVSGDFVAITGYATYSYPELWALSLECQGSGRPCLRARATWICLGQKGLATGC